MYRHVCLLLVVFALGAAPVRAATQSASAFVETLGAQAIEILRDDALTLERREARLHGLLREGFDLRLIGRFVLGRHWKAASPEQRGEYLEMFAAFVLKSYASRLGGYAGQSMTIVAERATAARDTVVLTRIERPSGPPIEAAWRLRPTDERWRIIDVVVEGISMAVTQRAEFSSVVRRNGLDGLIEVLRARTTKLSAAAE